MFNLLPSKIVLEKYGYESLKLLNEVLTDDAKIPCMILKKFGKEEKFWGTVDITRKLKEFKNV